MSAGKMGLVIRDPWYEFDTNLDQPNLPNTVAQDAMGALLSDLGARWVRLEFHIAGDDVAGQVARNDYFINEVAPRHGFKVLGLLSFDLLRGVNPRELITQPEGNDPLYGGGIKQYIRTWLDRARFIADRYQEKVHAYEILNEHNRLPDGSAIPAYLAARLHTKFYHFFHYRDRDHAPPGQSWRDNVPVLIGGLHPRGSGNPGDAAYVSDLDYLYQVYTHAWGGFPAFRDKMGRFPVDGIAYHPYPEEIRGSLNRCPRCTDVRWEATMLAYRLDELRQELRGLGQPDAPIWITEIGYNAAYRTNTKEGQAEFLAAVQSMLIARPDVAASFWFKYEDFPDWRGRDTEQWGLVHIPFWVEHDKLYYAGDGQPAYMRPAYAVFRSIARAS
jgi:hypothetical protein